MARTNYQPGWWLLVAAMLICPAAHGALKTLAGHVPAVVARLALPPNGRLPETNCLHLAIGLPLRDPAGLDRFLEQVYDPGSPVYRRFLTPGELTERFGPTEQDYAAVKNFAQTNGLAVTMTHGNRLLLDVSGPVAAVEHAFHLTLRTYRHPTEARDFFAPDREPAVDAALPIADVSGLDNYSRPHPLLHRSAAAEASPHWGSAPNGYSYFGADFRAAYAPGTTLDGTGQSVGLVQFEGYYSNDVTLYATLAGGGRTNILVQPVYVDGFSGVPVPTDTNGIAEVSLDIEMNMSMAPGLSQIVVFEGNPNDVVPNDLLNTMAASNTISSLASSWSWSGGPATTTDNIFKIMAAQGQSYFNASGDYDALPPEYVEDPLESTTPTSNPYITIVGGTTLNTTGPGGAYESETVWNVGYDALEGRYVGSSGGVSSDYPVPSWQLGVNSFLDNGGSPTRRNYPDVALTADNIYVLYNHTNGVFGGTSCAVQLWSGFMALVNQQAFLSGHAPVGFANPALYEVANESIYPLALNDITTGNNTWASSTNHFYAVPGYDLCTGLGTPTGTNLINALVAPDPLLVVSNYGFSAFSLDGAFPVTSQTFYVTNVGSSAVTWTMINTCAWLNVTHGIGVYPPGAGGSKAVWLDPAARNLGVGTYTATVWFTNFTTGVGHARFFSLTVTPSLVENGGFETGDFTNWTLFGNTIVGNNILNAVESPFGPDRLAVAHSGQYGAFLGDDSLAVLYQALPTVPGRQYVLSFWLNNTVSGPAEFFEVNWNTNGLVTNTIYAVQGPPVLNWTNFNFVVRATGTNATLQFGAENPPNYFGLDDVSVTPVPAPSFAAVKVVSNGLALTWNAVPHASYVVQYTASLVNPNWQNLGAEVTAASNTVTQVDASAVNTTPERFYRVALGP